MRPRHARRIAERREANRNQAGYSPAEWEALSRNERRHIVQAVKTVCLVCGGPDGPECGSCTARHDHTVARNTDV